MAVFPLHVLNNFALRLVHTFPHFARNVIKIVVERWHSKLIDLKTAVSCSSSRKKIAVVLLSQTGVLNQSSRQERIPIHYRRSCKVVR